MSYIDDNLATGEVVQYRTRLHWVAVLGPLLSALVFGAGAIALFVAALRRSGASEAPALGISAMVCAAIALVALVVALVIRSSTEMAVTNRRVLMKSGVVSRKTVELLLNKVESIAVNQSVMGRLAGYGSIVVRGTGGTFELFDRVAGPLQFRRKVQEQIDQQSSAPAQSPSAAR